MSTLTKVLIILLTVCSIFLCGIVVTYVANADNFKKQADTLRNSEKAARDNERFAKNQLNEKIKQMDTEKAELNAELASLQAKVGNLEALLDQVNREKAALQARVDQWVGVSQSFTKTTQTQEQLLRNTLAELERVRADQIKQNRELKETSTTLMDKLAVITLLEEKNRRLTEEKADLNKKLDGLLRQFGKAVVAPVPVTQPRTEKALVAPETREIGLKGLISVIDLKHSMAEISIGSADGVKEGMKFHVTRGDHFICDILILDVQPEFAIGSLELTEVTQLKPKAGDNVSTNL